jgi:hypothetical protein
VYFRIIGAECYKLDKKREQEAKRKRGIYNPDNFKLKVKANSLRMTDQNSS